MYKVQFASSEKKLVLSSDKFKEVPNIGEYVLNGIYKYTSGEFATIDLAAKQQTELRKKGFSDAFVVTFKDGKRIK